MIKYLKIILFGFLLWLILFIIAFLVFPLRTSQRAFFESIMAVVVTLSVVVLAILYWRRASRASISEGGLIGVIGFAISLASDLPLFLSHLPDRHGRLGLSIRQEMMAAGEWNRAGVRTD